MEISSGGLLWCNKTNRATINEDVTIPSATNGLSTGPVSISSGNTVTVNGEWVII